MTAELSLDAQRVAERLENDRIQVRRVYHETWNDYYTHKPDDTRGLKRGRSSGIMYGSGSESRRALNDRLKREKEAAARNPREAPAAIHSDLSGTQSWERPPTLLPAPVTGTTRFRRFCLVANPGNRTYHQVSQESEGVKRRIQIPQSLPRYDWCTWSASSMTVPQEPIMPFLPYFMPLNQLGWYRDGFRGEAWNRGYGGPADLHIMVETVNRLKEMGMREIDIDRTRVLPKANYAIDFLRLNTDLFQFPQPGEKEWRKSEAGYVTASQVDQRDLEKEGTNGDRVWCSLCATFFCDRHVAEGDYPVHPRSLPRPERLRLAMPHEPCSDKCALLLDPSELDLLQSTQSEDDPYRSSVRFGKDQIVVLRCLLAESLDADEEPDITYCDAAGAMGDTSCRAVALELREWRRYEQVEQKPVIDIATLDDEAPSTSPQRPRPRPKGSREPRPVSKGVDFSSVRYEFCTHEGDCVLGKCICAAKETNYSCEAGCHCSDTCERRWRGCTCTHSHEHGLCDSKCECKMLQRQCDPRLCACARVATSPNFACENMRVEIVPSQSGLAGRLPKKTVVMVSTVPDAGYGLFAAEDLEPGDFLFEYTGEIIVGPEADRRSFYYDVIGRKYSFSLDGDAQHVDAYRVGTEARFMNWNSKLLANVAASVIKVKGNPVIVIHARKRVKRGEELRLDYGEDSERLIRSIVSPEKLQRGPQGKATLKRKKFNRPTNPNDKP